MKKANKIKRGWECPKCGAVISPHINYCVNCRGNKNKRVTVTPQEIEDIFQPIPIRCFGVCYANLGVIYPKGWVVDGVKLARAICVPTEPKYARELSKCLKYFET